jgi:poly(A) polymerase
MTIRLAPLMERSEALRVVRAALGGVDAWVVGGTVRDLVTERPIRDVDLVVRGDAAAATRDVARAASGPCFQLSERFGAWRVLAEDRSWQADISPVRGDRIEEDLALRDFTVNAMAVPLAAGDPIIDPHSGLGDLDHGLLRALGEQSFRDDPLRTLRLARFACELRLDVDPETKRLAAAHANAIRSVAPERSFYELRRTLVTDEAVRGVHLIDETGLIAELLPELNALKGVAQNPYHHLDVWGHTIAVLEALIEIERDAVAVLGEHTSAVIGELARPLGDELSRGEALRLAALLHDIGKPATRRETAEGRVLFLGHDQVGAELCHAICRRLRTSTDLEEFLAAIARHHLRLGFLVHERPLSRRAVYRYLRACEPVELEVTVLSVADRLATRGERTRQEAIDDHLGLARELAGEALAWRAGRVPELPVTGDDLIEELGLGPGPRIGELLEQLREASFTGEISSREEAIELARRSGE